MIFWNTKIKYLSVTLFVLLAGVIYVSFTQEVEYFLNLFLSPEELGAFVESYEPYGFLILFALQVSQVILALVPGQVVATVFGSMYGIFWGTLLGMIGNIVATVAVILIAKEFGRPIVEKLTSDNDSVGKYQELIEKAHVYPFVILILLPVISDDVVCYAAGLTSINKWRLIFAISVARLPAMFVLSVFGNSIVKANWNVFILFAVPTGILILLVMWKRTEILDYLSSN